MKKHTYKAQIDWTGNQGKGTKDYKAYSRDHVIHVANKYDDIQASSDPSFRGNESKYNPEDLFISSLAACHMLWYLHLCSVNQVTIVSYRDTATGTMELDKNGGGKFTEVTLNPEVIVTDSNMLDEANKLHEEANKMCFIANSCNFKIAHAPVITVQQ